MSSISDTTPLRLRWPATEEARLTQECAVRDRMIREGARWRVAKAPFRVCPLGAHVDHQGGVVSAMAIDCGVCLIFAPAVGTTVSVTSANFNGRVEFDLTAVPARGEAGGGERSWGRYVAGAAFALQSRGYKLTTGLVGHVVAPPHLHEAGISSSAAVGVAYLLALEEVNGLTVTAEENVELDRVIENEYLGLKNGVLDQSAILLSRAGHLTIIDCMSGGHRHVALPSRSLQNLKIMLAFSGVTGALTASSGFNGRVQECQQAARALTAAVGDKGGERGSRAPLLRDTTPEEYQTHKAALSGAPARRAAHFFGEQERVRAGEGLWAVGALTEFGRLMRESGSSSVNNYEVGVEEMNALQGILWRQEGVYGARFSGAGMRGACVALVESEAAEDVARATMAEYRAAFPQLAHCSFVCLADSGGAARVEGLPE